MQPWLVQVYGEGSYSVIAAEFVQGLGSRLMSTWCPFLRNVDIGRVSSASLHITLLLLISGVQPVISESTRSELEGRR